jgi:uncharacterized protein YndB with AHSA1/START domain
MDELMIDASTFATRGKPERPVIHEAMIAADPMRVFDTLTTSEGVGGFLEVEASVELAIGGSYELLFNPDDPPGQRGSEGCRILAYVPGESLSFSWNAPPVLPAIRGLHTWVVITLTPVDAATHVRLVHTGFAEGPDWEEDRRYFERAWGNVLAALQRYLAGG